MDRDELLDQLVEIQYTRNDFESERGTFRVRGDVRGDHSRRGTGTAACAWNSSAMRSTAYPKLNSRIRASVLRHMSHVMIFPASHYAISRRTSWTGCIWTRSRHDLDERTSPI